MCGIFCFVLFGLPYFLAQMDGALIMEIPDNIVANENITIMVGFENISNRDRYVEFDNSNGMLSDDITIPAGEKKTVEVKLLTHSAYVDITISSVGQSTERTFIIQP